MIHFGPGGGIYYFDGAWRGYAFGWPLYDNYYDWWDDDGVIVNGSYYDASYATSQAQTSPAAPPAPPRELSDEEKADEALADGDADAAARRYSDLLQVSPSDAMLQRKLAVAMLDQKKPVEGVAVMAQAYAVRPELALKPLEGVFLGDSGQQRRRLNAAVTYAHSVDSASAWLVVMALMQGEGRDDVAANMLPRAEAEGLDPELVKQWKRALGIQEEPAKNTRN